jgi:lipopolysaccharide/colanic/teichoic acid biosynthesis glycosyltransferase
MLYTKYFKRTFDIIISVSGLILTSPILILIIILIFLSNHGDVFFIQKRPGKNGNLFKIIKFKTMADEHDSLGRLLPDDQRLTKLGSIIRKTSLDELPQLLNVVKGDMSFIGPRPLLVEYLPLYNKKQARRHEIRPGMTGWAQVNGRNAISWEEKFKLDVWYVDNVSFFLDIKILFMTIRNVFTRKGISKVGYATTEAFNGRN